MPVETSETLKITCDNPDCPGTDLPTDDRTGWLFVSSEIYGQPTVSHVFCSTSCASVFAENFGKQPEPTEPA